MRWQRSATAWSDLAIGRWRTPELIMVISASPDGLRHKLAMRSTRPSRQISARFRRNSRNRASEPASMSGSMYRIREVGFQDRQRVGEGIALLGHKCRAVAPKALALARIAQQPRERCPQLRGIGNLHQRPCLLHGRGKIA